MGNSSTGPLRLWERGLVVLLLLVTVAFGVVVEYRTAFLKRRMGDLGCYLRAAWAVRTGADLYAVMDDNGWHYNYPPLLAILAAPLADPPAGVDRAGMAPWPVSAAIWYVLNVACLVLGVHWLATALERTLAVPGLRDQPRGCRRWWALRVIPVLVCLVPIGHTLMRGQVNLQLLALLCGAAAGLLLGQRFRAGLCLAGMICVKVFPAYLLVYPLWRRDGRCLAGCAAGLVVGLGVVPLAVFGPEQTVAHYRTWAKVLVGPALGAGGDQSRAQELTQVTSTDTQAFHAVIHNTMHLDRGSRPPNAEAWVRVVHWLLGSLLTVVTLVAGRRRTDPAGTVLLLGALTTLMLLLCPVCHLHNLALLVVLAAALLAASWERTAGLWPGALLAGVFALHIGLEIAPQLPGLEMARDLGLAMYAALLLWLAAVIQLWRGPVRRPAIVSASGPEVARAA